MTYEPYDPPRHALATLKACGGDLEIAFSIAHSNTRQSCDDDQYWFWAGVRNALDPKKVKQC